MTPGMAAAAVSENFQTPFKTERDLSLIMYPRWKQISLHNQETGDA